MEKETLLRIQKSIEEAEKRLSLLWQDIQDARRAGLDTSEMEKRYNELKRKIEMLKAVYMKKK